MNDPEARVRIAAIVMLAMVLVVAITALVVVAVATDRTLNIETTALTVGVLLLALLGGAVLVFPRLRDKKEADDD